MKAHAVDFDGIWQSIGDCLTEAVFVTSSEGKISAWNRAATTLFGYRADEALGRHAARLLTKEQQPDLNNALGQAYAGNTLHLEQLNCLAKSGATLTVSLDLAPVIDSTGTVTAIAAVARAFTEQPNIEDRHQDDAAEVEDLYQNAPCGYHSLDADGFFTRINDTELNWLGYQREEVVGRLKFSDVITEDSQKTFAKNFPQFVKTGKVIDLEFDMIRKDRSTFPVLVSATAIYDAQGRYVRSRSTVYDMTRRRHDELGLSHLYRIRAVTSGINSLMIRASSRQELFEGACRIAVDKGGFLLAWIGEVDDSRIRPVAAYGADNGYVEKLQISLDPNSPQGQGPSARAMREGQPYVINDIARHPAMSPWREAAIARGFRSSMSYPFIVGDETVGSINLYAGEIDFFDDQELDLLRELASDITFAIEFLGNREQLYYLAYYDRLTGLANRKLFDERVNQYLHTAQDIKGCIAVLVFDVVEFSAVNASHGRRIGDRILLALSQRLAAFADDNDKVARVAGDRFAIVLSSVDCSEDLASLLGGPEWEALVAPYWIAGLELRLSLKVGIALSTAETREGGELFDHAESALKRAKGATDVYMFYEPAMSRAVKRKLRLDSELRRAVEKSEFELHYQPKVDVKTGYICGAEALLRWRHPKRGLLPPGDFLHSLEQTGLIASVGDWALTHAVESWHNWESMGLKPVPIAVNVASQQLDQAGFVERIAALMDHHGKLDGSILELEMTESTVMRDISDAVEKLTAIRTIGVPCAIDDFGTGYSSLNYLAMLPVAALKIDRSFIGGMLARNEFFTLTKTIISLAHSLNLKVIAEGVESPEQYGALRLLGCNQIQGYLISRPLDANAFGALLDKKRAIRG